MALELALVLELPLAAAAPPLPPLPLADRRVVADGRAFRALLEVDIEGEGAHSEDEQRQR